jgi:hypothetical protein
MCPQTVQFKHVQMDAAPDVTASWFGYPNRAEVWGVSAPFNANKPPRRDSDPAIRWGRKKPCRGWDVPVVVRTMNSEGNDNGDDIRLTERGARRNRRGNCHCRVGRGDAFDLPGLRIPATSGIVGGLIGPPNRAA